MRFPLLLALSMLNLSLPHAGYANNLDGLHGMDSVCHVLGGWFADMYCLASRHGGELSAILNFAITLARNSQNVSITALYIVIHNVPLSTVGRL